jgi:hypothetical protein
MLRLLRGYFFWTYERGSVHYDVMVTLILAFIFITPHVINYKDRPPSRALPANGILVTGDGPNTLVFQVEADAVPATDNERALRKELKTVIAPVSGGVNIDHYETVRGADGTVLDYRIWVRR